MVTPENGLLTFQGRSGRQYSYNIYSSDVIAAPVTFSLVGAAGTGSTNFITAPEDMTLVDASITTGQTVSTNLVLWLNDAPAPAAVIMLANIVSTLANRSFPQLKIAAGRKVQFVQA